MKKRIVALSLFSKTLDASFYARKLCIVCMVETVKMEKNKVF